jgi:hypothetical protein
LSLVAGALVAAWLLAPRPGCALNPDSPEVKQLIRLGLDSLEKPTTDTRLGAKCLQGLALHKGGRPGSPRIKEAIEACRAADRTPSLLDVYSHGLAILLLCETGANESLAKEYIADLVQRQKEHGGWGYDGSDAGDTSQTQYMALALWEARNRGLPVSRDAAVGLVKWLLSTQGTDGGWGYQGQVWTTPGERVVQSGTSPTMVAAATGSLMIGRDLFGQLHSKAAGSFGGRIGELPKGVTLAEEEGSEDPAGRGADGPARLNPAGINWRDVDAANNRGHDWISRNLKIPADTYPYYFLYALERYESFREYQQRTGSTKSLWYDQGYAYLLKSQQSKGVWDGQCGPTADTAFAVLFLMRSTQKSIKRSIGDGTLVSGRGLPNKLSGAKLRGGQVVRPLDEVGIAQFLGLLDAGESDKLDQLADDPAALVTGKLDAVGIAKLERTLRGGAPSARVVAARALGRSGDLDRAPALLYAMTDPDRRVVLEADSAMRYLARRTQGGLPPDFTDEQRYAALEAWKRWYGGVRPEAVLELE